MTTTTTGPLEMTPAALIHWLARHCAEPVPEWDGDGVLMLPPDPVSALSPRLTACDLRAIMAETRTIREISGT